MKIAIPTRNNHVDDHFGHCEYYTVISITNDNKVEKSEVLESPKGCGCKTDIASTLQRMGVTTMLAGNMGQGAVNKINASGIRVIRGCSGDIIKVVDDYLNQKLNDSGLVCDHHDHDHECNH